MDITDWGDTQSEAVSLEAMDSMIEEFTKLRDEYDAKKEEASKAWELVEKCQSKIMQALEKAGKKSYKVDGLGTFSVVQKQSVTTPKTLEEKSALYEYIRKKYGEETLFSKLNYHAASLNSFYNEEFEASGDPMFHLPGVGQPVVRAEPRFTKARK